MFSYVFYIESFGIGKIKAFRKHPEKLLSSHSWQEHGQAPGCDVLIEITCQKADMICENITSKWLIGTRSYAMRYEEEPRVCGDMK